MATVIEGGEAAFNAFAFGEMHPGTQQFLQTQMEQPTHTLTQQGQRFFQGAQDLYQRFENSRSMRLATAAKRALGGIWNTNEISHLNTVADLQWAPERMRRLIMAEPEVRRLYHEQRIEGYGGVYQDAYPNDVGEDHYDYKRVMDGVVVFNESDDPDEPEWSATTYFEDWAEFGDRELELEEQVDVIDTWASVVHHIRRGGDDPTSRFNAAL